MTAYYPNEAAYERIAQAAIITAFRDLQAGNGHSQEAREFLHSEWCQFLLDSLGYNPNMAKVIQRVKTCGVRLNLQGLSKLEQLRYGK